MSLKLVDFRGHPAIEDRWNLLHRHSVGAAGEAFLAGLERGELIAARCPSCERTLLPPRSFCERCFAATEYLPFEARDGELLSFTVVRRPFAEGPETPFAIGYARLSGASTALGALFDGVDLGPETGEPPLRVGMDVRLRIGERGSGFERLRLQPGGAP